MQQFKKQNNIFTIILSILLGISFSLKKLIKSDLFISNFKITTLILWSIIFTIISFLIINAILYSLEKIKLKTNMFKEKKLLIISFLVIFLSGLLFLVVHYPGVGFYDTFLILDHPVAAAPQHPIFYNLLIGIPFRILRLIFKDINFIYFLISLGQLILCSCILTYIISWFNRTIKNKLFTIILLLYFSIIPIVSNYNMMLIKDSLFGIIFIFYIPLLYELIKSKGKILDNKKYLICLGITLLLTTLLRNNGIYVIMFTMIILTIFYKKYYKKLIALLLIVIILSHIPNLFIKNKILFQEKVGIPIQQIAYVVKYNENSISKKDKDYLNKLMDLELIKEKYDYSIVDPIKWDASFNSNYLDKTKTKFIKTWFNIMKNNFSNYVKSYLLMTYNLWAIDKYNPSQSRYLTLDVKGYVNRSDTFTELKNTNILPERINTKLKEFYDYTTIYVGNGLLFYTMLLISLYAFINKKKELIILFLPIIGVYLTLLISAPISYALRYMSTYLYCLPILILIIIKNKRLSK